MMTRAQEVAIATAVQQLRPDWDHPGIVAALRAAQAHERMTTNREDTTMEERRQPCSCGSEPERECEHPQHPLGEMGHSGPAWALVEVIHLCASPSRTLVYVCRGGWDEAGARGTHCQGCGENLTRDQSWRIVQVLR